MRTWFYRHPNVAVVLLVLAWVLSLVIAGRHWDQREWLLFGIWCVIGVWLLDKIEKWWHRT